MKKFTTYFILFFVFQSAFSIETKEIAVSFENDFMIIDVKIPSFYNNGKYLSEPSSRIKGKYEALIEISRMESNRYFLERLGKDYSKFILNNDFKKITNNMGIDSYSVKSFYYIGGKHGMMMEEGFNFKDGKEIFLKDIFKDNINYRGLIRQKIEEQIINSGGDMYYSNVDIPKDGYSFYFKDDSLVIIFDPYIIASYEAGIITFEIPVSEISDFMKI